MAGYPTQHAMHSPGSSTSMHNPARTMSSIDRPLFVGLYADQPLQPSPTIVQDSSDLRPYMHTPEAALPFTHTSMACIPMPTPTASPRSPAPHSVQHSLPCALFEPSRTICITDDAPHVTPQQQQQPPPPPSPLILNPTLACKHDAFTLLAVVLPTGMTPRNHRADTQPTRLHHGLPAARQHHHRCRAVWAG